VQTLADVRRLLGHGSVKTTSIYLDSDGERQETSSYVASAAGWRSTKTSTAEP